ncbi:MAG: three-Cys-motif partner protein TcmP [Oligoflexia bacterium]|nr:three-Cys-motif partner protein TcmP [Oligoflexia bacterium]
MDDLDKIGYWTEIKLNILKEYAGAYAKILSKQSSIKHYAYIDAFAGAGHHFSETTGNIVEGSPVQALGVDPPFSHYHFVEMNPNRIELLNKITMGRKDVSIYQGDSNQILVREVFPKCKYSDFRRALCLLDPYQLNPSWDVVLTAGKMKSIEIFLNFMIMDANMNVLWKDNKKVNPEQRERMTTFWGDDTWENVAYKTEAGLFENIVEKTSNKEIIKAYQDRLKAVAGFEYVPDPLPMRNSKGLVVYYLFFASHNETGARIAKSVFKKWKNKGY